MGIQGVGNTEITLGILKIDRIDLVRHGRGTHFTGNGFLLEVTERNIGPEITAKIYQHGIKTGQRIKLLGHVVMGFDLRGIGIELKPQASDELP